MPQVTSSILRKKRTDAFYFDLSLRIIGLVRSHSMSKLSCSRARNGSVHVVRYIIGRGRV